jgi:hypothetical protein
LGQKRLFFLLLALALLFGLFLGFRDAINQSLDYDGSINLQVPPNVGVNGSYASDNPSALHAVTKIDPVVTTGPTLLLPIAVSFKIFSTGVIQFRLVMLFMYLLTAFLLAYVIYKETGSTWAVLAPLLFLLIGQIIYKDSNYLDFRTDPVGEIPAALCSMVVCYFWAKGSPFKTGFFIGLAIIAKFTCLLFIPALFIALEAQFIYKKFTLISVLQFAVGLTVPIATWEMYKFVSLSGLHQYLRNWKEFIDYFKIAGSDLDQGSPFSISDKARTFSHIITEPSALKLVLAIMLVLGVVVCVKNIRVPMITEHYSLPLAFFVIFLLW